jgi:hypothetical protein
MKLSDQITKRFLELEAQGNAVAIRREDRTEYVDTEEFQKWASSALHLVAGVFGETSPHFKNLSSSYAKYNGWKSDLAAMRGVFLGAKADFMGGYLFHIESSLSGEIFGDFILSAKLALADGQKDVAAVLACAALEDALKSA